MDTVSKAETSPPWEDWEDHGGFDDEDALMGSIASKQQLPNQERPWYYEKKQKCAYQPITFSVQLSFL